MFFDEYKKSFDEEIEDSFQTKLNKLITYMSANEEVISLEKAKHTLASTIAKRDRVNERKDTILERLIGYESTGLLDSKIDRYQLIVFLMERMNWNKIDLSKLKVLQSKLSNLYVPMIKDEYTPIYIEEIGGAVDKKTATAKWQEHCHIVNSTQSKFLQVESTKELQRYHRMINFMDKMNIECIDFNYLVESDSPAEFLERYENGYPEYLSNKEGMEN